MNKFWSIYVPAMPAASLQEKKKQNSGVMRVFLDKLSGFVFLPYTAKQGAEIFSERVCMLG